jgi:hypothetical protein
LKFHGPGAWLTEKHGAKKRRSWRKLHIGLDADTDQIVASELTRIDIDDSLQVAPLLQIAGPVASRVCHGRIEASQSRRRRGATIHRCRERYSRDQPDAAPLRALRGSLRDIAERGRIGCRNALVTTNAFGSKGRLGGSSRSLAMAYRRPMPGRKSKSLCPSTSSTAYRRSDTRLPSASRNINMRGGFTGLYHPPRFPCANANNVAYAILSSILIAAPRASQPCRL